MCATKKICVLSNTFCAGITTRTLFLRYKLCKRRLNFTTVRESTGYSSDALCQISQIFVFINHLLQSIILSPGAIRIYWRKYVRTCLLERPLYLQGKLVWTRLLFGIRQTGAKPLLELMLVSFILTLRVRQCQLVCTRDKS